MKKKAKTTKHHDAEDSDIPQLPQKLIDAVDFTPEDVLMTAAGHATLFHKAVLFHIDCTRYRSRKELSYETIRADKAQEIRTDHKVNDMKLTEDGLKEHLRLNPSVRKAFEELTEAQELEIYSKLFLEAFRHRRDCIKVVSDLKFAEHGMQATLNPNKPLETIRERTRKKYQSESEE